MHPRAESFTRQLPHDPARIGAARLQAFNSATDRTGGRDCRDRMYPLVRSIQLNVEGAGLVHDYRPALGDRSNHKIPRQKPDRGIELLGDLVRTLLGGPKGPPEFVPGSRSRGGNAQVLQLNGCEDTGVEPRVKRSGAALEIVKIDNVVTD